MGQALTEPQRTYKRLWRKTGSLLKSGRIRPDPHLRDKAGDYRRGITLVARPDAVVRRRVGQFLGEVAALYPRQHFYKPVELHVTVMTIISGSELWRDEIKRLPACRRVLQNVLRDASPFRICFRGVTASPDAVMIQGFPADEVLSHLRHDLREGFGKARLGGLLDRRYRTITAHLTVMRFSRPAGEWRRLQELLQAHRNTDFGEACFRSLQLIWGDWYASTGLVRVLREYPLKD
jgi:2'-5' RNA ligase